jgi:hypothetical protein
LEEQIDPGLGWRRPHEGAGEPGTLRLPERDHLVLAGTGIPDEIVGERFRAGDSIAALAADFRVERARIEQALRWEQCAPRAA